MKNVILILILFSSASISFGQKDTISRIETKIDGNLIGESQLQTQLNELVKQFDAIDYPLNENQKKDINQVNLLISDKIYSMKNSGMSPELIEEGILEIKRQRLILIKAHLDEIQSKKLDELMMNLSTYK